MLDLRTNYMGLELAHPIVASASPIAATVSGVEKLQAAGAAAIVLPSLFEEQIVQEQIAMEYRLDMRANASAETQSYVVETDHYCDISDNYLTLIKESVQRSAVPIIASLNGVSASGWLEFSKKIQEAGAHAIELNVYSIPTDFSMSSENVESRVISILKEVKANVSIPVALKLGPYFSSPGNMALKLEKAGADALVLFNRFYQPDLDIEKREADSSLVLSSEHEIRLPLTWIGLLYEKMQIPLAATSGVTSYREIVKYLMAGANVVMTTSALLRNGPDYLRQLHTDLVNWMVGKGYQSIEQLRGSMSREKVSNPDAYERTQYMKVLQEYEISSRNMKSLSGI